MGVIRQILNAPGEVPFRAAHQLKRALDEGVNWESPAKKQVQQITKGLRSSLRDEMRGFRPYDQATHAYESILPLYREGLGAEVRQAAIDNPESLVRLIKRTEPTKAAMFRDLLLRQAEAGGDANLASTSPRRGTARRSH